MGVKNKIDKSLSIDFGDIFLN